jgi:DHA1 family inner membrane transport protein
VGSAIGGVLFARGWLHSAGFVSAAFVALALAAVILTRPRVARMS